MRSLQAWAGLSILLAVPVSGQQGAGSTREAPKDVRLRVAYATGERFTLHRVEKTEGKTRLTVDGKELPKDQPISSSEETLSRNRVLKAEDGRITRLEKKIEKSRFEARLPGSDQIDKGRGGLEGKTLVLARDGGRTTIEKAEKFPAEELEGITLDPDPVIESIPAEAIPVGREWAVEGEALEKFLSLGGGIALSKARADCKLEKIEPHRGSECGAVRVTLKVEGKGEDGFKLVTELKGTIWIAIAEKKYAGQEFEGTFETSGFDKDQGAQVRSSGKVTIKETIAYEK